MLKINLKQEFSDDYITRRAGERLRKIILEAFSQGEKIEIDFTGLLIASTSFFDEGFAKLGQEGWNQIELFKRVLFKNIHEKDRMILDEMLKNRKM